MENCSIAATVIEAWARETGAAYERAARSLCRVAGPDVLVERLQARCGFDVQLPL